MFAAVALAALLVVGVAVAVLPPPERAGRPVDRLVVRQVGVRCLVGAAVGLLVLVVSGWLVAAAVVGVGAFVVVGAWMRRRRDVGTEIARLDALASWIENVRDVLMAGEQPVGAIGSTVHTCPPLIRPHVRRLAAGLSRQDPEVAFRRFADDLDDPLADLVAAGLAIAIRRGARTVPVLTALAEQTRQQVDRRRLIEAERAPTRREVQALTVIMSTLVVALLVFGRSEYLDSYDTVSGQLFLASMLALYGGLLVRVQQLAAFPRPARFLTANRGPA